MDVLWDLVGFVVKSLTVFVTFAASAAFLASRLRMRRFAEPFVRLTEVSARWRHNIDSLSAGLVAPGERRKFGKLLMKRRAGEAQPQTRVFVLDFKGDLLATAAESLREEVTVVLGVTAPGDEVVLRLESSGGAVHGYGFAASQLARLRDKKVPLTVCVDKVAASGGYMMACVGDKVLAAPFAILGSIGVVAPVPNLHRLLDRFGVDYEDVTAGKHKRTVTLLGVNTEEGRAKFKEQIDETHTLFKRFVTDMRPSLDIETVATGEHWYGTRAVELGLVDALRTSDDYLLDRSGSARIFEVKCDRPHSVRERAATLANRALAAFG